MDLKTKPAVAAELQTLASRMKGEVRWDDVTRRLYATDASAYQELPLAVAFPRNESDLPHLIQTARRLGVGLIPRTAGTSLAGQVVGAGIVVDVSLHWTRILEINPEEQWVRVQPGVIRDELNLELAKHGLLFGPETSTANRAMIGGMLGNNSCGSNSVVYGSTRDHTLEVSGYLSDGSFATFGPVDRLQLNAKLQLEESSLEGRIYRETLAWLTPEDVQREIRQQFPKPAIERRNTGYAIDLLLDAFAFDSQSTKPLDLCQLLAGSEGTLFFTTEIKLRCLPLPPPHAALQCAHFETVDQALRATLTALEFQPYAVELMDHLIIEGAMRNRAQRENASFVEGTPGAILVTELRGDTREDVQQRLDQLQSRLQEQSLGYHFPILEGDATRQVWQLRKAGLGIVANVPGDEKPVAVIEDTAVDVADLPGFIREFNQILADEFGMQCVHYAHAGSGELHLRPILNLKTESGNRDFRRVAQRIAQLVKQYRGSLSGEHGDGRLRGEFLPQMVGDENYQLIRKIKQLWDPDGIFNPGKIVDTPPMNTALRYAPGQMTHHRETVFDFDAEQGLQRAAELCSGSGDCRKTQLSGGTMCPSYMATRREEDSTRGRANLLRQVLTEAKPDDQPLGSNELLQVMDLCLSCKGCQRECPSNVDVAKLKAEFLQGYYDVHGVPTRARRIAGFAKQMRWAAKLPWFFNWLTSTPPLASWIKRWNGFAVERSLPKLHRTTLRNWFAAHQPHANAGQHGSLWLFCDEFTDFNDTPIGIAAVELLERLGWKVQLADHVESGRAALSKGLLRQARELAETNVERLAGLVSAETPLVGIEPSAILSFRDEYPNLVRPAYRERAERLAANALMFDEFFAKLLEQGSVRSSRFREGAQVIRLHGHCHQKALASLKPTIQMLQTPKGHRVRLIPSGCCGMAGSFGYEKEHYELSMQIGELVLFPTIRDEPDTSLIAAPGTSCRHQIHDGTGRQALHPIEILRQAWLESPEE